MRLAVGGALVLVAAWITAAPAAAAGLTATLLSPAEIAAEPRRPATVSLELGNTGASPLTTVNTIEVPAGWSAMALPAESELAAGATAIVFYSVSVPAATTAGSYPLTLTVTPAGGAAVSLAAAIRVAAIEQLTAVVTVQPTQNVLSGAEFSYEFLLTNLGNADVTAYLTLEARPEEWVLTASATELRIASGQSATLSVTVTAPEDLADVVTHRLTLKAYTRSGAAPEDEPAARVSASAYVVPQSREADAVSMYAELRGGLRTRVAWDDGGKLETQQTLELGGTLGPGRELRFNATPPSVTDTDLATFTDEARASLKYTDERWGYAALGDQGVSLGAPLLRSSTNGRGAEVALRNADGEVRAFYVYPYTSYGSETIGVQLSTTPAPDTRLSVTALNQSELSAPFNAARLPQDTRAYSLLGETLLGGVLSLSGEVAQTERGDVGSDTALRVATRYRGDDFAVGGEYVRAGADYLGAWQDEELYRGDLSWSPAAGLRLWSNYTTRRENIDDRPGVDGGENRRLQLGTSWQLSAETALRITRNVERDRDVLTGTRDEQLTSMGYELSNRWDGFRLSAGWSDELRTDRLSGLSATERRLRVSGGFDLGADAGLQFDLSTEEGRSPGAEASRRTQLGMSGDFRVGDDAQARLDVRHNLNDNGGDTTLLSGEWRQRVAGDNELTLRMQHNMGAYGDSTAMALEYTFPLSVPVKMVAVRGAVTGRLYLAHDAAQGLAGVLVALGGDQVVTAEDGSFSFPGVEPGDYELNVSTGALGVGLMPDLPLPHPVTVAAGETVDVQIPVVAAVYVSGKVLLTRAGGPGQPATTVPLPEAVVELVGPEKSSYRLSDGAGRFMFGDLQPGAYRVLVRPEGIAQYHEITPEFIEVELAPGESGSGLEFMVKPQVRAIQITTELSPTDG